MQSVKLGSAQKYQRPAYFAALSLSVAEATRLGDTASVSADVIAVPETVIRFKAELVRVNTFVPVSASLVINVADAPNNPPFASVVPVIVMANAPVESPTIKVVELKVVAALFESVTGGYW
jgi:hypothetical protein